MTKGWVIPPPKKKRLSKWDRGSISYFLRDIFPDFNNY